MAEIQPDYESVCKLTGQLFLESRYELERVHRACSESLTLMKQKLVETEKERDEALSLLARKQDFLQRDGTEECERSHGLAQDMGGGF